MVKIEAIVPSFASIPFRSIEIIDPEQESVTYRIIHTVGMRGFVLARIHRSGTLCGPSGLY